MASSFQQRCRDFFLPFQGTEEEETALRFGSLAVPKVTETQRKRRRGEGRRGSMDQKKKKKKKKAKQKKKKKKKRKGREEKDTQFQEVLNKQVDKNFHDPIKQREAAAPRQL